MISAKIIETKFPSLYKNKENDYIYLFVSYTEAICINEVSYNSKLNCNLECFELMLSGFSVELEQQDINYPALYTQCFQIDYMRYAENLILIYDDENGVLLSSSDKTEKPRIIKVRYDSCKRLPEKTRVILTQD